MKAATGRDRQIVTGNILTMDPARPRAGAMVIAAGRIVFVGDEDEAREIAGAGADAWHFPAGAVLPGLIDSHNHMLWTAMQRQIVDLSRCTSIAQIVDAVRAYAAAHPSAPWIVGGGGWHLESLAERRYPTRQELDAASPDRPVFLPRVGHAAAVNSLALQRAGIDRTTPDPPGGRIERDARGDPTGVLLEPPAFGMVGRLLPPMDEAKTLDALREIQRVYHAAGLCGVVEPGLTAEQMQLYRVLHERGELTMRTVAMPLAQTSDDPETMLANLDAWDGRTGDGDDRLKLGGVKVFLDGGASLGTALMREPYPDERCNCGIQVTHTDMFHRLVEHCARNRWSLGVHAVGGKAIDIALAVFDEVDRRHPIGDMRFQLIHAYLWPSAENIATARRLGVGVATQASMQYQFAPLLVQRFGAERVGQATPIRSWLDAGVIVAGGSDSPVTPYPPLLGIWHATTRFVDALGQAIGTQEGITSAQALALYTRNAAWTSFSEHERGMLSPGLLGDWIALSVDPLAVPPDALRDAQVVATAVGGQVVHRS